MPALVGRGTVALVGPQIWCEQFGFDQEVEKQLGVKLCSRSHGKEVTAVGTKACLD